MDENNRQEKKLDILPPIPSSSTLRDRQSVRATFKLTERSIDTISILSAHLGIKQKSLFDHLIDDIRSLHVIAQKINQDSFDKLTRTQKTFVISRKTLCRLEEASKEFDAPRDALVEYSVQRLLPVISEERERHRNRKKILRVITEYLKQGDGILEESLKLLGIEDPVYDKFKNAIIACRKAQTTIEDFVLKGEIIEDF